ATIGTVTRSEDASTEGARMGQFARARRPTSSEFAERLPLCRWEGERARANERESRGGGSRSGGTGHSGGRESKEIDREKDAGPGRWMDLWTGLGRTGQIDDDDGGGGGGGGHSSPI